MANTIQTQVLNNGPRNLALKIHIDGDGSGDEAATQLIDASVYHTGDIVLVGMESQCVGFSAELMWDATTDVHCMQIPDYDVDLDLRDIGGIRNNAGAGKTSDVNITTTGLGLGDSGHIILHFRKE